MKKSHEAHLAHNINNASTIIIGCASLIKKGNLAEGELSELLDTIKEQAKRCSKAANDVRTAAVTGDDKDIINFQHVEVLK